MRVFLARIWGALHRRSLDRRLDEELRFHLEMEADKLHARGMAPEEAVFAASRNFGGAQQIKERYREQRGLPFLEVLLKDLHYGLRMIRRSPGFSAIAVLSLALGIGANTAIFSLIDAVILRSLPVKSPQELVAVGDASRPYHLNIGGPALGPFSYPLYTQLRDRNTVFTGLLASGRAGAVDVAIHGRAIEKTRTRLVSGNYFEVLGVPAALGRTFTAADDRTPGASPIVVISYAYWVNRFAGDARILGRKLTLNDEPFTIVGVGPRGFVGEVVGDAADIWIPLSMQAQVNRGSPFLDNHDANWLLLLGRLKQGISVAAARAQLTSLAIQTVIAYRGPKLSVDDARELRRQTVEVEPGGKGFSALRKQASQPLLVLMIVVGLVLLIACANVANLLLARAAARQREISVRLAVGAGRGRLVRQLLTESLLLSLMGGAAGLLLSLEGSRLLLRLASSGPTPLPLDTHPNPAVLAFTCGLSLFTGIVFGLVPALRSTRVDLAPALKETSRAVTGSGWQLGKLLVVGQVAVSLSLLIASGLFIRSLANLETLDVGFSRPNLTLLQVNLAASGYTQAQQFPVARRMLEHLQSIPGVAGVTVSENGIFSGTDSDADSLRIDGFTSTRKEDLTAAFDQVGPRYFQVVGVPILAGRDFDDRDHAGAPGTAILNETMAHFYFGRTDPVGKSLINGKDHYTIVGVARDMKEHGLKDKPERRFFIPLFQSTDAIADFKFEIRSRTASAPISAIRAELQRFDSHLKIISVEPVAVLMDRSINEDRVIAQLCGFFGVLALLLAATGLHGVMAYATSRRTSEIGVRMALGASRVSVIRMILRETFVLVALGIAIGLPTALLAARLIASTLAGLSSGDPATLTLATLVMLIVALAAGFIPAERASRIDPLAALRQD